MIWEILILLAAVPTGYLIAWLARDELIAGRKYFRILIILGLVSGGWFYLIGKRYMGFSSGFISIVSLMSLIKSNDKRWTRKRR